MRFPNLSTRAIALDLQGETSSHLIHLQADLQSPLASSCQPPIYCRTCVMSPFENCLSPVISCKLQLNHTQNTKQTTLSDFRNTMTHSEKIAQTDYEHLPWESFIWMLQRNSNTGKQNNAKVFTCHRYYEVEAPHAFKHGQTPGDKWGANKLLVQMENCNTWTV